MTISGMSGCCPLVGDAVGRRGAVPGPTALPVDGASPGRCPSVGGAALPGVTGTDGVIAVGWVVIAGMSPPGGGVVEFGFEAGGVCPLTPGALVTLRVTVGLGLGEGGGDGAGGSGSTPAPFGAPAALTVARTSGGGTGASGWRLVAVG